MTFRTEADPVIPGLLPGKFDEDVPGTPVPEAVASDGGVWLVVELYRVLKVTRAG